MIDTNSIMLLSSVNISFLVISHWWLPAAHSSASSQLQKICRWCRMPISAQIMTDLWTILRIIPKPIVIVKLRTISSSLTSCPLILWQPHSNHKERVSARGAALRRRCDAHYVTHILTHIITNWMNCQNKWDNLLSQNFREFLFLLSYLSIKDKIVTMFYVGLNFPYIIKVRNVVRKVHSLMFLATASMSRARLYC